MARIYLSHSHKDIPLAKEVANGLMSSGNEVFIDSESLTAGSDWRTVLNESLKESDVFLVLLTKFSIESHYVMSEIGAARAYTNTSQNDKLFIPIVFDNIDIPNVLQDIQAIHGDRNELSDVIAKTGQAIGAFFGRKAAAEQRREQRKQQIEASAANYIQETIEWLKENESKFSRKANSWNIIGWISLIMGVLATAGSLIITNSMTAGRVQGWAEVSLIVAKSIIIVALLVASSKYAFTLAKSYMEESLKNADRIHAISFGKFFLQAFGDKVDTKEAKEVFQHWNISKESSFTGLDANMFDPKLIEAVLSVAEVIKSKASEKNTKE